MTSKWIPWIVQALRDLGGEASLAEIYKRIETIHPGPLSKAWQATVRNRIESYSSDSDNFAPARPDLFHCTRGKGQGQWGLRPGAWRSIEPPSRHR